MTTDPAAAFDAIAAAYKGHPDVTEGTGFGANPGLRVDGHIFAMLVNAQLVVKLPVGRIDELVGQGSGQRFESGRRVMREWLASPGEHAARWRDLADEAFVFVGKR